MIVPVVVASCLLGYWILLGRLVRSERGRVIARPRIEVRIVANTDPFVLAMRRIQASFEKMAAAERAMYERLLAERRADAGD